jgi:hypothetical protein
MIEWRTDECHHALPGIDPGRDQLAAGILTSINFRFILVFAGIELSSGFFLFIFSIQPCLMQPNAGGSVLPRGKPTQIDPQNQSTRQMSDKLF